MDLLERDARLAALTTWLDESLAGAGRLVLVGGEAGAGKSVLLREFSDVAARRSSVLWGACDLHPFFVSEPVSAGGEALLAS